MNPIIHIEELVERYPILNTCKSNILEAYELLSEAYSKGCKLLVCGNGGSASDSEHIVGELMKEFKLKRKIYSNQATSLKDIDPVMGQVLADNLQGALPAICLTGHSALTYGNAGDVFLGISTSGNSNNVLYAAITAKSKGLKVIGLTGAKENKLMNYSDVCIRVPETETFKIQELHLPVYHCLCLMLEQKYFG